MPAVIWIALLSFLALGMFLSNHRQHTPASLDHGQPWRLVNKTDHTHIPLQHRKCLPIPTALLCGIHNRHPLVTAASCCSYTLHIESPQLCHHNDQSESWLCVDHTAIGWPLEQSSEHSTRIVRSTLYAKAWSAELVEEALTNQPNPS